MLTQIGCSTLLTKCKIHYLENTIKSLYFKTKDISIYLSYYFMSFFSVNLICGGTKKKNANNNFEHRLIKKCQVLTRSPKIHIVQVSYFFIINMSYHLWNSGKILHAILAALRDQKGVTGECSVLISEGRQYYNCSSMPGRPGFKAQVLADLTWRVADVMHIGVTPT